MADVFEPKNIIVIGRARFDTENGDADKMVSVSTAAYYASAQAPSPRVCTFPPLTWASFALLGSTFMTGSGTWRIIWRPLCYAGNVV